MFLPPPPPPAADALRHPARGHWNRKGPATAELRRVLDVEEGGLLLENVTFCALARQQTGAAAKETAWRLSPSASF